ncbi:MAG: hypothetical protein OEZ34_09775 [Spirochaetia bacterium]|nr:hypothetical protein [Spirochaetia bacterium]
MKFILTLIIIVLIPSVLLAEVSDKMPSVFEIALVSVILTPFFFIAGYFRWWLGLLCLPFVVWLAAGTVFLWNETAMRNALFAEQGWIYFGSLIVGDFIKAAGIAGGIYLGYKNKINSP